MSTYFKFELLRFFRRKTLIIFVAVAIIMLMLNMWTYDLMSSFGDMMSADVGALSSIMPNLSGQYGMMGALTNASYSLVLALLVVIYICSDNSNGTLKNVLSHGYSRMSVYGVKYAISILGAYALAVVCWLFGFVFGGILWGFDGVWDGSVFAAFGVQAVSILAYTTLFFLISCTLKGIGGSIVMSIVMNMVPTIVLTLLDLFITDKSFNFMDFWIEGGLAVTGAIPSADLTRIAIVSAVYAVVLFGLSLLAVHKREV